MQNILKEISGLVEEISENAEGFNHVELLEAVHVSDFSEAVCGDTLLEQLRLEGLL